MKKYIKGIILSLFVIICSVITLECSRAKDVSMQQNRSEAEVEPAAEAGNTDSNDKAYNNEEFFYEHTDAQDIDRREADEYWDMLLADNVFKDDTMALTGLFVDDMDDNGVNDLLVMIIDYENLAIHGAGCVWFYMNEDEPYCFDTEEASYYGDFDFFAKDIDNDENVELVLSTYGWGTGFPDTYKAVFKYKDHDLKRMELPSDYDRDDECGIHIKVNQGADKNQYSAYCSYFDEEIFFEAENCDPDKAYPDDTCYGTVRGFFYPEPIEYQGKNALQVTEYLAGEGGWTHLIATAEFIILWDENGNSYVDSWWIETEENTYK